MSFTISPDAVTPEYLAEDKGPAVIATASVMMILCTAFVGLRYWARYLTHTPFGAEDVMIPFAWLAEIGICVTEIVMVEHAGSGRHLIANLEEDPNILEKYLKGITVNEFLHPAAVAFPKLCVIFLYLHVFTNKYERMVSWALITVVAATWFSFTVATLFSCMPLAYAWDKSIENGSCFDFPSFATSSSVPNIVTDVAVLFLPIRTVLELKISIGRKAGLMLIFLTGSIGIVASIIRTVVFATTDPLFDPTFATALLTWTIIEPGLYLLAACALSFKPLFRMVARVLHLDKLITYGTTSPGGRNTHNDRKTSTSVAPTIIRMETFKSGSSGGFSKLSEGKDVRKSTDSQGEIIVGKDIEEGRWVGSAEELEERYVQGVREGVISVMVTRTVEVESESWPKEEREMAEAGFNAVDQSFLLGMLDTLDKPR